MYIYILARHVFVFAIAVPRSKSKGRLSPMQEQDGNKYVEYDERSPKKPHVLASASPEGQTGTTPGERLGRKLEPAWLKIISTPNYYRVVLLRIDF